MPIYEFECSSCGERFDRLQKLSDPDPTECPKCGAPKVHKRLNAPAFRLAGSGWYETDFKKDGDKKRNLAGSDDGGGSTAAKSDSAPATTGEGAKPASTESASTAKSKPASSDGT